MFIEVLKYDNEGKYVEPVLIEANDDGTYELPENCTVKPLPQPNWKPVFNEVLNDWVETITDDERAFLLGNSLPQLKQNKLNQLNQACESTILGRFSSTIDGVVYEFSYDMEAQSRFNGMATSFTRGYITEIEWTCYLNGERTSVILSEQQFDVVAKDALNHVNSNIAKFREKFTELDSATLAEQVNSIVW